MKEAFKHFRCFYGKTIELIAKCNAIIADFQAQGYTLTLRQLYYQLVGLALIPNHVREYDKLGEAVSNARLAGLIDWDAIEDRTRGVRGVPHWEKPNDIIQGAAHSYRIDKWQRQPKRIEVWVEKDALVGVLEKACRPLDVKWFSCRGYTSQTALYDASKRLLQHFANGQEPVVIHLGDHDPSGIDMTRDIFERLEMFLAPYGYAGQLEVNRIALNMNQVDEHHLPENPAKESDSRFKAYQERFGDSSWELDALNPKVIDDLITETILQYRDQSQWDEDEAKETGERDGLAKASARWAEVVKLLEKPQKPPKIGKGWRKLKPAEIEAWKSHRWDLTPKAMDTEVWNGVEWKLIPTDHQEGASYRTKVLKKAKKARKPKKGAE